MEGWIGELITSVGPFWVPWVVFSLLLLSGFGIPLGEDIIIIPAGILLQQSGELSWWSILLAAYAGVVLGDLLWFSVCAKLGTRFIHKRWFRRIAHPRRMLQLKYQIDVRGVWVIVFSRFVPASRTTTITVAGMMHMKFWKFALSHRTLLPYYGYRCPTLCWLVDCRRVSINQKAPLELCGPFTWTSHGGYCSNLGLQVVV